MAEASEGRDIYVNHGKNLRADQDDPYVIHGKNLIAEVNVTAHSHLVRFFELEGLSVSSEDVVHTDTVRVHISGQPETVDDSVSRFLDQNPEVSLRIFEAAGEGEGADGGGDEGADGRHDAGGDEGDNGHSS
ncbi:MAG TPA: hypothetical protein VFA06_21540 [Actinocrinis sp.]|jgi:hypothetical protein|uniref:hypothetical protein n=1 Tax=Actinocrinis sp. TaxID=1920516 RepID=UPI002D319FB0|nr:hypothetical protein [Actinocrinis sp.]HZU58476.1 hypothetical protein [Actinocrinis sp.]